jgi:hypothetical protein
MKAADYPGERLFQRRWAGPDLLSASPPRKAAHPNCPTDLWPTQLWACASIHPVGYLGQGGHGGHPPDPLDRTFLARVRRGNGMVDKIMASEWGESETPPSRVFLRR